MWNSLRWISYAVFILIIMAACSDDGNNSPTVNLMTDFESGSIGTVLKISNTEYELSLADDNDNSELPDRWRNWWYFHMENLKVKQALIINLKNRGWPYYYLPVYSFDQQHWHRFVEDEVSQDSDYELRMEKQFGTTPVWIARFYPYTYSDLETYMETISDSPYINIEVAGITQAGHPIHLITITDFDVAASEKKRIWMHARTHPAETAPSFLIEGLIDFLISNTPETADILTECIIHIVPMQNVDGVIAGNYRTTLQSENLEVMWFPDVEDPMLLTEDTPEEVEVLHHAILELLEDGPPITIALNLHASNSEPDIRPFFYPHFGPQGLGYNEQEASLWEKQIRFIDSLAYHYGGDMLEPVPEEGGESFAAKNYPESWWWRNFQDQVMAITFELTYGRAGYMPRWITPDDIRELGQYLALALRDYYDNDVPVAESIPRSGIKSRKAHLKYPEQYPPNATDELKE